MSDALLFALPECFSQRPSFQQWQRTAAAADLPDQPLDHLRALLYGTPSPKRWRAICALMDIWPEERGDLDVGLSYALDHLLKWPDDLRIAPVEWLDTNSARHGRTPTVWPLVRTIHLTNRPDLWDRAKRRGTRFLGGAEVLLRNHALFARITALDLGDLHCHKAILNNIAMLRAPALRSFTLNEGQVEAGTLAPIIEAPFFAGLTHFRLGTRAVPTSALKTLVTPYGPAMALEVLDLGTSNVSSKVIAAIARSSRFDALHTVRVSPPLSAIAITALARRPSITHLALLHPNMTTKAAADLGRARLKHLTIASSALAQESLEALGEGGMLEGLDRLTLSYVRRPSHSPEAFLRRAPLTRLRRLDLGGINLGNAGVIALAENPDLTDLEHLDLSHNRLGPDAFHAVATSTSLTSLKHLDLSQNKLGNGLGERPWASALAKVETLSLHGSQLGLSDVRNGLIECKDLGALRHLDLSNNHLGAGDIAQIAREGLFSRLTSLRLGANALRVPSDLETMLAALSGLELDVLHLPNPVYSLPEEIHLQFQYLVTHTTTLPIETRLAALKRIDVALIKRIKRTDRRTDISEIRASILAS